MDSNNNNNNTFDLVSVFLSFKDTKGANKQ